MTEPEWLASEHPGPMVDWLGDRFTEGQKIRWVWACRRSYSDEVGGSVILGGEGIYNNADSFWSSDIPTKATPQLRAHLLREVVGNPHRPVRLRMVDPNTFGVSSFVRDGWYAGYPWLTPAVLDLASHIRETRDWELLGPLWDLLETAGCDSEEIEKHCRGLERCPECLGSGDFYQDHPFGDTWATERLSCYCETGWFPQRGEHDPGCWVLTLLLGEPGYGSVGGTHD